MRIFHLLGLGMTLFALTLAVGCDHHKATPSDEKKDKDGDHDHGEGPHKGVVFDFGKYHAEFTVDHPKQEVTIYILDGEAKKPVAIKGEKMLLSIKSPKFEVELKADPEKGELDGKSSRFVAKHEKFGKEQEFEGMLSGVVDGKKLEGDFKEEPDDHHKEKK